MDVLGASAEGMIGYMIEQELGNALPFDRPIATILTVVEVDPADPAFAEPTKFIGKVYEEAEARAEAAAKGWTVKPDGKHWRRVVPSPVPKRIFQMRPSTGCRRREPRSSPPTAAASRRCTNREATDAWSVSSA